MIILVYVLFLNSFFCLYLSYAKQICKKIILKNNYQFHLFFYLPLITIFTSLF